MADLIINIIITKILYYNNNILNLYNIIIRIKNKYKFQK